MATRPTDYTLLRTPSSQPGETKKTSSCASCCGSKSGHRPLPLRRTFRVRDLRPTPPSSHQSPLHCRASAGQIPRPRRTDGHPLGLSEDARPSLFTAGVSLPFAEPPSLPNGTRVYTPTSLEGNARTHFVLLALFFRSFRFFCPPPPSWGGGGWKATSG